MFEEWIAYPDRRAYIPREEHFSYGAKPGWWVSGWTGNSEAVERMEAQYRRRQAVVLEPESDD